MFTGLAVAVGLMAAIANNQPEVPPAVPPHSAPIQNAPTPFRSGFSQPRLIPEIVVSDRVADDLSVPGDVIIDSLADGEITSDDGY